jgi:hypothetical protein
MGVDFDAFVKWAENRFDGDVVIKGKNVLINSVFAEDHKHHLSCCPSGGKKKRPWGVYRCYYSEKRGTLLGLVMHVDQCGPDEARDVLQGRTPIHLLEKELEKYFLGIDEAPKAEPKPELPQDGLALPPYTFLIKDMPEESPQRQRAIDYLSSRCIPWQGMYFCTGDEYADRVIVPYYDRSGKRIYWNGRSLGRSKLRYRGPPREWGIGKGDVLFFYPDWPVAGSTIYLTEGEFDAISLSISRRHGVACGGKSLSEAQVEMLRPYKVVLCLDNDDPGLKGLMWMGDTLIAAGVRDLQFVRPARGLKDWNKMLEMVGAEVLGAYVDKYVRPYDSWTREQLMVSSLY